MSKSKLFAGCVLALMLGSVPASATVLVTYDVTFSGANASDDGTGILKLNLPSFPDTSTINYTSLPNSIFSSLTATIGSDPTFTLTDSNIAFGGIQGSSGSSFQLAITESTSGLATGTPFLALYGSGSDTGTFQAQLYNEGSSFPQGTFTIGAPFIAATTVPEPSTLSLFIGGSLLTVGFLFYQRKKRAVPCLSDTNA